MCLVGNASAWYITSHNSLMDVGAGTYCTIASWHTHDITHLYHKEEGGRAAPHRRQRHCPHTSIYIYISSVRDKFEYIYSYICIYTHICTHVCIFFDSAEAPMSKDLEYVTRSHKTYGKRHIEYTVSGGLASEEAWP